MFIFEISKYGMLMINDSETFCPVTSHVDISGRFTEIQLIYETVFLGCLELKRQVNTSL